MRRFGCHRRVGCASWSSLVPPKALAPAGHERAILNACVRAAACAPRWLGSKRPRPRRSLRFGSAGKSCGVPARCRFVPGHAFADAAARNGKDEKRARPRCIAHLPKQLPSTQLPQEDIELPERVFHTQYERKTVPQDLYVRQIDGWVEGRGPAAGSAGGRLAGRGRRAVAVAVDTYRQGEVGADFADELGVEEVVPKTCDAVTVQLEAGDRPHGFTV
jgi:hypothetical protein